LFGSSAGDMAVVRLFPRLPALWRACATGATLGVAIGAGLRWLDGGAFVWPQALWLMAATAVGVLLTYITNPTLADGRGLRAMSQLGWPVRVAWADIAAVELRPWWTMWRAPALCVVTASGRRLWLMRESHGLAALHALAVREGGPDHPLVRALETPLHRL
jgi:hypothetical protein